MKGKRQPTLTGYTDCQILSNIARPNWQLEISHGGRIYTRAVDGCYHQGALFFSGEQVAQHTSGSGTCNMEKATKGNV